MCGRDQLNFGLIHLNQGANITLFNRTYRFHLQLDRNVLHFRLKTWKELWVERVWTSPVATYAFGSHKDGHVLIESARLEKEDIHQQQQVGCVRAVE